MSSAGQPTRIRYIILALTVCVAVLLYLDRYCLGYVTQYVREDLRLTGGQVGFMLGAFFYTYAFFQLPGGWLADRYGTRWMLSIYLASWSLLTGLTGFADSYLLLLALRFGCGMFEAGAYPACAGLIRRWFPYHQRGLASGIVSLGGRIGGAITPVVTGTLILFFMPVEKPSLINAERDLLDPRGLAKEILRDEMPKKPNPLLDSASTQFAEKMSEVDRRLLATVARTPGDQPVEQGQVEQLATTINEWLKDPKLFFGMDLEPIKPKLTRQALHLFEDLQRSENVDKATRLNRNILEVLYPGKIRQVIGDGWPPVLMMYGVIGVLVAIVFFAFHRDTPREHFLPNEAEAKLAEDHGPATTDSEAPLPAGKLWRSILTDVSLWASSIMQFGTNFCWVFLGNQTALYLFEVHEVPEGYNKMVMTSLPFLVALPALLIGGWWTDWMTKKYGPRVGRGFPIASTRFATALAFALCWFLEGVWPVVIVLSLMSLVHDLGLPAVWGYNLDVGKRNVGVVLGWGNMWGNLGAAVSPYVLVPLSGMFATKKAGYDAVFLTCAAVFVAIGFVSLFIDASKPIGESQTAA